MKDTANQSDIKKPESIEIIKVYDFSDASEVQIEACSPGNCSPQDCNPGN